MRKVVVLLFLIGLTSAAMTGFYIIGLLLYVFSDAIYTGEIAYMPKWIFPLSIFTLLGKRKEAKEFIEKIEQRLI
jgi:hypothetical protein